MCVWGGGEVIRGYSKKKKPPRAKPFAEWGRVVKDGDFISQIILLLAQNKTIVSVCKLILWGRSEEN